MYFYKKKLCSLLQKIKVVDTLNADPYISSNYVCKTSKNRLKYTHKISFKSVNGMIKNIRVFYSLHSHTCYIFLLQSKFPVEGATPVLANRGDVVIFSYLLVHGSPANLSTRPRRMLLLQVAAAEDKPLGDQPVRPGQGWLLRGVNIHRDASISKRFNS